MCHLYVCLSDSFQELLWSWILSLITAFWTSSCSLSTLWLTCHPQVSVTADRHVTDGLPPPVSGAGRLYQQFPVVWRRLPLPLGLRRGAHPLPLPAAAATATSGPVVPRPTRHARYVPVCGTVVNLPLCCWSWFACTYLSVKLLYGNRWLNTYLSVKQLYVNWCVA